jgi:uncharacterized protein (UPF0264 family)
MTRLLVSVRSGDEARAALDGGADLIDVKEPTRGALGAADPAVWSEVAKAVHDCKPTSVALGELIDGGGLFPSGELAEFDFAKIGLAGCGPLTDWPKRWRDCLSDLPEGVTPVAVVYADWRIAQAPPPDDVIAHAASMRCGAVLFDTYDKTQGGLLDHFDLKELDRLSFAVRRHATRVVLAGSLHMQSIPKILHLQPDYVAVRGAACAQGRCGRVDSSRVRELARVICSD